jgi:hypothetical protein
MKESNRPRTLRLITVFLVLGASLGLVSAAIFGGIVPGFEPGGIHTHSPTVTYQGYFSVNYQGVYHFVQAVPVCRTGFPPCLASDESVFYLNSKNGTIRLIFYCGGIVKEYCNSPSQLPFIDGACLHVKGTLLEPSKWPSDQFSPSMHFNGDLYVFENQTLPAPSCH